jgi:3'-phosphoadenosine 5'-phosphosulfate sulfotransferase (PAPS reductase)/FAD synthetase
MLTVLSFGGGQDSFALLCKLIFDSAFRKLYAPGELIVLMANTNDEHPHTDIFVTTVVAPLCAAHGISFFHLQPNEINVSSAWVGGLLAHYKRYKVIISKAMRAKSCTHQLKIAPIYKFLSRYVNDKYLGGMFRIEGKQSLKVFAERFGKVRVLIGISHEEAARRINTIEDKELWMRLSIRKIYPLVDLGMDRKACQQYVRDVGQPVPFPSNCVMCPFASKIDLLWLKRNLPARLAIWQECEKQKLQKFATQQAAIGKANHGVWGQQKTLDMILLEAEKEFGHLTNEELNEYKMSHGHCVKSRY